MRGDLIQQSAVQVIFLKDTVDQTAFIEAHSRSQLLLLCMHTILLTWRAYLEACVATSFQNQFFVKHI